MIEIKNLSTQTNSIGSSPEDCISKEEYENLCNSGELTHGVYVCGLGYCLPPAIAYGSGSGYNSGNDCGCGSGHWFEDSYWGQYFNCGCGSCCGCEEDFNNSDSNQSNGNNEINHGTNSNNSKYNGGISVGNGGNSNSNNTSISDILSPTDFRGYKSTDSKGCLNRCREMLAAANCQLNGQEIAMMLYDSTGRSTTKTDKFTSGINYINSQLSKGHPVIVAVDYKSGTSLGKNREDQSGDHFVIIVGGNETCGYHYYDPATSNIERGTSESNKFTLKNGIFKSTNICTGNSRDYTLSSIRKNL